MNYTVIVMPRALRDLDGAYLWASRSAPETAARWLNRFHAALRTLSSNPERCGIAPESEVVGQEIRQFLFGKRPNVWRALFTIQGGEVRVLHVRRAAMDSASADELGGA
jgi:plasmid stabilization system protein ParE